LITNENSFLFEIKIGIDTVMDFPPVVFFNITTTMTITNSLNSSSIFISIFIGICMSLIALITALGNIVVLLAFYCDKKLRTINGTRSNILYKLFYLFFVFEKIILY
jgi:hypothetical protein